MEDRRGKPAWVRYGVAAGLVALALVVILGVEAWIALPPFAPFYAAIAFAAWFGGLGPALLAIALSLAVTAVWVMPLQGVFSLAESDLVRLSTFLVVSVVITILSASRDRSESALRASERRFRTILETANEGVWLVDRKGRTLYANDRMIALLGTTAERIATASVLDFVLPHDDATAQAWLNATLAGRPDQFDFRFRREDGSVVHVLAGTSPVRDDSGRAVGALGLFTDVTARRQAQQALARANERFALAVDAVQAMIYEWDTATNVVERSAGLLPLLGYRPDEASADQEWWRAQIHPDDRALSWTPGDQRDFDIDRYSDVYRVRHRDGHWITVWDQGRIVRDASGQIVRVVGSTIDITARTEAENALRLHDEAGKALASSLDYEETLQRVVWLAVPALADWCFVDLRASDGAMRRVAVAYPDPNAEPLAGTAMRYPPSAAVRSPAFECMTTGVSVLIEQIDEAYFAATAQDDAHRSMLEAMAPASLLAVPLLAGGTIHGVMTLMTSPWSGRHYDSDDLALAEQLARRAATAIENARLFQKAQEAEARYRGLFEGTRDGILVSDDEGRFVDANPAMAVLSGYSREELLGLRAGAISTDGASWGRDELERLHREGSWRDEWELRRRDGSTLTVESDAAAIQLSSGLVQVAVIRDVSARKRLEQIHQEFIATVAHDLKNPLTAMRGQTQLLSRRLTRGEIPDPERLSASLEKIDDAAVQMTALLDELADVMRLRAGEEIELRRMPADLISLVRDAIDTYARTSERHAIRFEATEEQVVGVWDGPRLERVLGNLLGNAVKYSPRGGEIVVKIWKEDHAGESWAGFSVADQGIGIPAADLPHLFERYHRGANVAGRFAGSGIGLVGARQIIEQHGGTIGVTSSEGQGSTFTVWLPMTVPLE